MVFHWPSVSFAVVFAAAISVPRSLATPSGTLHIEQATILQPDEVVAGPRLGILETIRDSFKAIYGDSVSKSEKPFEDDLRTPHIPKVRPAGHSAIYQQQVVVRFTVRTVSELQALSDAADTLFLDIWEAALDWVDIRLEKDSVPVLLDLLPQSLQRAHTPLLEGRNLTEAVVATFPSNPPHRDVFSILNPRKISEMDLKILHGNEFFREYRPLSVITSWLRLLQSLFTAHTEVITVGKSWEGRDILGFRVSVRSSDESPTDEPRKTIVISGGSHAREWISVSTVNYVLYSLVTGYGRSQRIDKLLQTVDFLFVPTLNPDGYVYSWDVDRLWRKTRQPSPVRFCQGIDLDRSWGYQWDSSAETISMNPCSENYAGQQAFEGVEAQSFASYLRNETANGKMSLIGMVDLHSYSEEILMPYSYSCLEEPPALEDLEELGEGIARAIRRTNGEFYEVLSACQGNSLSGDRSADDRLPRMQSAGGSPLDWFYHEMNVKYSYQIKLRDTGTYGFLLPPDWIVPQGEEILHAVMHLGRSIMGLTVDDDDDDNDDDDAVDAKDGNT